MMGVSTGLTVMSGFLLEEGEKMPDKLVGMGEVRSDLSEHLHEPGPSTEP